MEPWRLQPYQIYGTSTSTSTHTLPDERKLYIKTCMATKVDFYPNSCMPTILYQLFTLLT